MQMEVMDAADGVVGVTLVGRLDTPGVDAVETKFTATLVPRESHAIVDLSRVEFVGSMGIRMFIAVARSMARKQHKLVLFGATPLVQQVFDTVALGDIIPVATDRAAALAAARG